MARTQCRVGGETASGPQYAAHRDLEDQHIEDETARRRPEDRRERQQDDHVTDVVMYVQKHRGRSFA
jgi:hypothetical protein